MSTIINVHKSILMNDYFILIYFNLHEVYILFKKCMHVLMKTCTHFLFPLIGKTNNVLVSTFNVINRLQLPEQYELSGSLMQLKYVLQTMEEIMQMYMAILIQSPPIRVFVKDCIKECTNNNINNK